MLTALRAEDDKLVLNGDFDQKIEPWYGQKMTLEGSGERGKTPDEGNFKKQCVGDPAAAKKMRCTMDEAGMGFSGQLR